MELCFRDFIPYQALTRQRDFVEVDFEVELGVADLLIPLEWDVAADHVIEEDAQGPHGHGLVVIATLPDPLWRGVHPGAVKVGVVLLLDKSPAPKVNESESPGLEIYQDILVLDVSVCDPESVAPGHGVDDGPQEPPGYVLSQGAHLCNVIEQVDAVAWPLQDIDEGVSPLKEVVESDDPRN